MLGRMAQTIWGRICRTGAFYTYIDISQLAQIHEGVWTSARSEVYDHTLRRVTLSWPRSRATWLVPRPKPRPSRARFVSTFTQSRLERCRKRIAFPFPRKAGHPVRFHRRQRRRAEILPALHSQEPNFGRSHHQHGQEQHQEQRQNSLSWLLTSSPPCPSDQRIGEGPAAPWLSWLSCRLDR